MNTLTICKNCGGQLASENKSDQAICPYCDSSFTLPKEDMNTLPRRIIPLHFRYLDSIRDICASHYTLITSDHLSIAASLKRSSLFRQVQTDFHIPKGEDAYLIYHDYAYYDLIHFFSDCQIGMAFCTNGIYYKRNSQELPGKITWEEFKNSKISLHLNKKLSIDTFYLTIDADARKVFQVMEEIQAQI